MKITNIPSGPLSVNTYIVADEDTKKAFIVDPGRHNMRTVNFIESEGYEIEYIILTHGHGDHIGGVAEYMKDYKNAKLVAALAEKELLADSKMNFSMDINSTKTELTADIWVEDGDTLDVGNLKLHFIMTPGHTPGGMCILIDDVLFSGDTLFQQSVGRTDMPGGSFRQLAKSIREKLFVLPDKTKVYPGHMGYTDIGFEKRNNPFV